MRLDRGRNACPSLGGFTTVRPFELDIEDSIIGSEVSPPENPGEVPGEVAGALGPVTSVCEIE
jgi:hypothetical protein